MNDCESLDKAIEGATYVIHTASPNPIRMVHNEDELLRPAVRGTLNILDACKKHKVKKIIITSSIAAIMDVADEDKPQKFDDSHWSETDHTDKFRTYNKSKTLAEKAAWDWLEKNKSCGLEMAVICPGVLLGPCYVGHMFTSGRII